MCVVWSINAAGISTNVFVLFTHTVESLICNPVNDFYHLELTAYDFRRIQFDKEHKNQL